VEYGVIVLSLMSPVTGLVEPTILIMQVLYWGIVMWQF